MGKNHDTKDLRKRRLPAALLAVSLAASLAAAGCTTNHTLGNGTPTRSGPELRTAPTSGLSSGTEQQTPPPMTSSYSRTEASVLPAATKRSASRADRAAAIMARHQGPRGRYLGVVNPGLTGRAYHSDLRPTGQWVNPAMLANPQQTINSSISSRPNEALGSTPTSDGAAIITSNNPLAATPTGAATGLSPGTFAASSATPTTAVSGLPTVTAASGLTGTGAASSAVQVVRGTNGAVTVTNVSNSSSGNNQ
jgi:hypothetical protein